MRIRSSWVVFSVLLTVASLEGGTPRERKDLIDGGQAAASAPRLSLKLGSPTRTPVQRRLEPGETHEYVLPLQAGELAEVIAMQDGVDLQVDVLDPGGNHLFTVDTDNGDHGPERVLLVAEAAGSYDLKISARRSGSSGPYELRLGSRRPATRSDRNEAMAEALFFQAAEEIRVLPSPSSPERKLKAAIELWEGDGNRKRKADALKELGRLYAEHLEWRQALQAYSESLSLYQSLGLASEEGALQAYLGTAYERLSNFTAAEASYRQAMDLGRRLGNASAIAQSLYSLGSVYRKLGRAVESFELLERAREAWRPFHKPCEEAKALIALGEMLVEVGRWEQARARYDEAWSLASRDCPDCKAYVLIGMANLQLKQGEWEQAMRLYMGAWKIQIRERKLNDMAITLNGVANCYLNGRRPEDAVDPLQRALRLFERQESRLDQSRVLANLGWAYLDLGKDAESRRAFERALSLARGVDSWMEGGALLGLTLLERRRGDPVAAQRQAEAAVRSVEALRTKVGQDFRTKLFSTKQNMYGALSTLR